MLQKEVCPGAWAPGVVLHLPAIRLAGGARVSACPPVDGPAAACRPTVACGRTTVLVLPLEACGPVVALTLLVMAEGPLGTALEVWLPDLGLAACLAISDPGLGTVGGLLRVESSVPALKPFPLPW